MVDLAGVELRKGKEREVKTLESSFMLESNSTLLLMYFSFIISASF